MLAARLEVELLSIWVSPFVNFVMERSLQTLILLMWAPEGELCQFWFHKQCDQPRSWVSTTMTLELPTNSSTRQSFCSVFWMLLSFSHSSSKIWDHCLTRGQLDSRWLARLAAIPVWIWTDQMCETAHIGGDPRRNAALNMQKLGSCARGETVIW